MITDVRDRGSGNGKGSGSGSDESRRSCVICTTEVREIICWPCRFVLLFVLWCIFCVDWGWVGVCRCVMSAGRPWLRGRRRENIGVRVVGAGMCFTFWMGCVWVLMFWMG